MDNLEIRKLREALIACLNESPTPIEVKRYVLKDIYQAVEIKANEIVKQEMEIVNQEKENASQKEDE